VEPWNDAVTKHIQRQGFSYAPGSRVKILFVPSYLNGDDGIFNLPYYDLLIGFDLSLFPPITNRGVTPLMRASLSPSPPSPPPFRVLVFGQSSKTKEVPVP